MKATCKGSLAGCSGHLDFGSTHRLPQQNLKIPEHAYNRTLPSWLFDACLSNIWQSLPEIDSPLVTLMPFWSLPSLLKNSDRKPLLISTRFHT